MDRTEIYERAVKLRHDIHMHPELSGCESETKRRITEFLEENTRLEVLDRGLWLYAVYRAENAAKKPIAFRADFDAIKVLEDDSLPYASVNKGVAHKCGHDGHAAALAAFAAEVSEKGADRDIYFIFQHGEEIGIGGEPASGLLDEVEIEEIYAIHNFPGEPLGSVNTREKTICFASVGMLIEFTGISTHASTPELGKNPAKAISGIVLALDDLIEKNGKEGLVLATVVQIDVGEEAFGVSASKGRLLLTVRGEIQAEYDALLADIRDLADEKAKEYGLELEIGYNDAFPETYNHKQCVDKIKRICEEKDLEYREMKEPLRTSEDFGYYTQKIPGAMIWLGSGEQAAPLHNEKFDYPDELIKRTAEILWALTEGE